MIPAMYDIRAVKKLTYEEIANKRLSIDSVRSVDRFPYAVILQNVRSLYNVGSIFRSADSFRAAMVILTGYTPSPPRREISKTALDAEKSVPWKYYHETVDAIKDMKALGYKVYAVEVVHNARNAAGMTKHDFPAAFVMGNELSGLSQSVLDACDGAFEISMYGVKHSLNVAVAAGIVMYQAATVYKS